MDQPDAAHVVVGVLPVGEAVQCGPGRAQKSDTNAQLRPRAEPASAGAHGVDIHGQIISPHGGTIGAGTDELVVQRTFLTARFIEFVIQAAADGGR